MTLVGAGLARRGHAVHFLCTEPGTGPVDETIGPVHVRTLPTPESRNSLSWVGAWRMYHRALQGLAVQFVYQRSALPLTGMLAWSAARLGSKFVFAVANDRDLDGRIRQHLGRSRYRLYRYGLTHADLVIVQSRQQHDLLRLPRNQAIALIPSAVEVPKETFISKLDEHPAIAWVSSLLPKKRPLAFLDVVAKLPDVRFLAAAPPSADVDLTRRFAERARTLPNLEWLGSVPHSDMDRVYMRAWVLLNTSDAEGVPNTFLEAWARAVPVVSLSIDPDGVIERFGLGRVVGDLEPASLLRGFLADEEARRRAGEAGRAYVETHHALPQVLDAYESALTRLLGSP